MTPLEQQNAQHQLLVQRDDQQRDTVSQGKPQSNQREQPEKQPEIQHSECRPCETDERPESEERLLAMHE